MGIANRNSNNVKTIVAPASSVIAAVSTSPDRENSTRLREAIYDIPLLVGSIWKKNLHEEMTNSINEYDVTDYKFDDRTAVAVHILKLVKENLSDELSSSDEPLLDFTDVEIAADAYFEPARVHDPEDLSDGYRYDYKQNAEGNFNLRYKNSDVVAHGKFVLTGINGDMGKLTVNLQKTSHPVDVNSEDALYAREPADFEKFGVADRAYVEARIDTRDLAVSAYAMNHFSDGYNWTDEEIEENNDIMSEEMAQWSDALLNHGGIFRFSREQTLSAFRENRSGFQKVKGKAADAIGNLDEKQLAKLMMAMLAGHTPFEIRRTYSWDKNPKPQGFSAKRLP